MKKIILSTAVVIIAVVAYLLIWPLFKKTELNENFTVSIVATTTKIIAGNFVDGAHVVSGVAKVINADGANTLRFENFSTENGPDLFVYLATDNSGKDFVNLGKLKTTNGNFNYTIPANVNVEKYNNVLIWCRAFGVLFGGAEMR